MSRICETENSYIVRMDIVYVKQVNLEKIKDLFVFALFDTCIKLCVQKDKLTKYIVENMGYNNYSLINFLVRVEDIKKNSVEIKKTKEIDPENTKEIWDDTKEGLTHPWVWFKDEKLYITLPQDFLYLEEFIISNMLENITSYEIQNFENTKTIRIVFILKKGTEFLKDVPKVPYFTGLKGLFEKLS